MIYNGGDLTMRTFFLRWCGIGLPVLALLSAPAGQAQEARQLAINEVAWAGTAANARDEWIELVNNTSRDVDLTGWILRWEGVEIPLGQVEGNAKEVRRTVIPARGFFLLERTDDTTVSDVEADLIYTGSLANEGEVLELVDPSGNVVDTANLGAESGWYAGGAADAPVPYATMERINPRGPDSATNWAGNDGVTRRGLDASGQPLNGTPKARNAAS